MDSTPLRTLLQAWHDRLLAVTEAQAQEVVGTRWTRKELLGHLIDSAANNHQRFIRLQQGDLQGLAGYAQEHWVAAGQYQRAAWSDLVALWWQYHRQLALIIDGIDPACGGRVWQEGGVDLEALVLDYPRHQLHHLERLRL